MNLALRPATAADREFAQSVYFESYRWLIERLFGWRKDDVERTRFSQSYKAFGRRTPVAIAEHCG